MSSPVPLLKANLTVDQVNQAIVDVNILLAQLGNPGTLDTIAITTANGISGTSISSGSVATITLTLGAITPSSIVATGTISGSNLSGTNTGDQTLTGLGEAALSTAQTFSGGQSLSSSSLSISSNLTAVNLALNNNFSLTLSADTTLSNPTNITAGQSGRIVITQGAGSYTVAYGTYYYFPGGTTPTNSSASGAIDILYYDVISSTMIACNLVTAFSA